MLDDPSWLYEKYVVQELSMSEIGRLLGVHHSIVSRKLVKYNIPRRSRKDSQLKSVKGKKQSDEHREKISKALKGRIGELHHSWRGGRSKTNEGYVYVKCHKHPFANENMAVLEHRLVMERHIGRYLNPEEVVHHINEIKDDNRVENLHLFKSSADHTYYHNQIRTGREVELKYEYEQVYRNRKMVKRNRTKVHTDRKSCS